MEESPWRASKTCDATLKGKYHVTQKNDKPPRSAVRFETRSRFLNHSRKHNQTNNKRGNFPMILSSKNHTPQPPTRRGRRSKKGKRPPSAGAKRDPGQAIKHPRRFGRGPPPEKREPGTDRVTKVHRGHDTVNGSHKVVRKGPPSKVVTRTKRPSRTTTLPPKPKTVNFRERQ